MYDPARAGAGRGLALEAVDRVDESWIGKIWNASRLTMAA